MQKNTGRGRNRSRSRGNTYVTKKGNSIKINRNLGERLKARKDNQSRRKANRLATLPKGRFKRILFRLEPKRLAEYWFSREGAIMALKITGIGIVVVFVLLIGLFAYFRKDLPKLSDISGGSLPGSNTYTDSQGNILWQDSSALKRIPVKSDQISNYMKQATVAIEDKNFYHEGGFSVSGIIRAGLHDVFGGSGSLQGASTITEQVVKLNEGWIGNRSISTKLKEIILSVDLSREYSKDAILTGYLNVAPYGSEDYGVQAAAQDYFHEDASKLTLAQAAFLAAIPQEPGYFSPYSSPKYNKEVTVNGFGQQEVLDRQHYVLDQMVQQHYITQAQANAAKSVNIMAQVHPLSSQYSGLKDPYFVLAAKQELENIYGANTVNRGGWTITTTLNPKLQADAQNLVKQNLPLVESAGGDEEAIVGEDVQTGQIVSLVGGTNFENNQLNYAAGVKISPGSSIKPYVYSTLINNNTNVGAGSVLYDSQGPLPGYACNSKSSCLHDFDFRYPGPLTIRYALGTSRNVPAIKAGLLAVPGAASPGSNITSGDYKSENKWISTANAMIDNPYNKAAYNCYSNDALTQTTQCGPAAAIGDGAYLYLDDHVNGLATIARMGKAIPATFISKITDANGNNVPLPQWKPTQVIKPDTAYIMNNMLSDPRASYFFGSCSATNCTGEKFQRYNGWDIAAKTGTTNYDYDGLMTAWSTKYAVVSWAGYHTRQKPLTMESDILTEPLTKGWIEDALSGQKPVNWKQPSDIKTEPAFVVTRNIYAGGDEEPSPSTDIYPSWYVPPNNTSSKATIDKVSGLLATSCTPSLAKETQGGTGNANAFSIDIFYPPGQHVTSGGSIPTAKDNVHNCGDQKPTVTLTVTNGGDSSQSSTNSITCDKTCQLVAAATQGTHPLYDSQYSSAGGGYIQFLANGKVVNQQSLSSADASQATAQYTYTPSGSGSVTLSANIVDSVLYEGSSNNVAAKINQGGQNLSNVQATYNPTAGGSVTVSWSGGTAPFTVTDNTGNAGCVTSSNTCTYNVTITPPNSVTVTDADGNSQQASVSTH